MEWADYLRFVLSLGFVLGLIGLCAAGAKRFGLVPGAGTLTKKGKDKRLQIVETLLIDTRNRLVLLRVDGEEHLLLVGTEGGSVIKNGVTPRVAEPHLPTVPEPQRFPGLVDLFTVARP